MPLIQSYGINTSSAWVKVFILHMAETATYYFPSSVTFLFCLIYRCCLSDRQAIERDLQGSEWARKRATEEGIAQSLLQRAANWFINALHCKPCLLTISLKLSLWNKQDYLAIGVYMYVCMRMCAVFSLPVKKDYFSFNSMVLGFSSIYNACPRAKHNPALL